MRAFKSNSNKEGKYESLKVERLESVKIEKCQNAFFFKNGKCQNPKMSELESVSVFLILTHSNFDTFQSDTLQSP